MKERGPPVRPAVPGGAVGPSFWREIYGFAVITLVGAIIALAVLPPKARRYWSLHQLEADLHVRCATIEREVQRLEMAAYSLETDPVYREAALRVRLGVKKRGEEFLKPEADPGR